MTSTKHAVLASLTIAIATAAAAERADPVVMIDGTTSPAPVTATNPGGVIAPAPGSTFAVVSGTTTATVLPAPGTGKRLVVKHLSMFLSADNSGVPLSTSPPTRVRPMVCAGTKQPIESHA